MYKGGLCRNGRPTLMLLVMVDTEDDPPVVASARGRLQAPYLLQVQLGCKLRVESLNRPSLAFPPFPAVCPGATG